MIRMIRAAVIALIALTILTGVAYPLFVTGLAKVAFRSASTGSLIEEKGVVLGSHLLGRDFTDPGYFFPRPSGTGAGPYDGAAASGTNLAVTNPALADRVAAAIERLDRANRDAGIAAPVRPIPVDLVTSSGSGLDPHISPASADYQLARVAHVRGRSVEDVQAIVTRLTRGRTFGILGEPRVAVLEVNLEMDRVFGPIPTKR